MNIQVRRANAIVLTLDENGIIAHNFIQKTQVSLNTAWLNIMKGLNGYLDLETLLNRAAEEPIDDPASDIKSLIKTHILVVESTVEDELDINYASNWPWGHSVGFYHFSIKNTRFLTGKKSREWIKKLRMTTPSPPLITVNGDDSNTIPLKILRKNDTLSETIYKRRSIRKFSNRPLTINHIGNCLFAGNGIIGFSEDPDFGVLPLATTPSGGARNPYELYLIANNINGIKPAVYHYDSLNHNLVFTAKLPEINEKLFGEQKWPVQAPAIIILVANFNRTYWKYQQATAYRVVLMEAGFIAQNILLYAAKQGFGGTPTAALFERALEKLLSLDSIKQAAILAIPLGFPCE